MWGSEVYQFFSNLCCDLLSKTSSSSVLNLEPDRRTAHGANSRWLRSWVVRTSCLACFVLSVSPVQSLIAQYTITTVAGGSTQATPIQALSASIGNPQSVAIDGAGNLYFTAQNCVFMVDRSGTLNLIAGSSLPGYSGDGGPAVGAQLHSPQGLAVDSSGNVYIADTLNSSVREITPDGTISTVAGVGSPAFFGDGAPATDAWLNQPTAVAIDGSGNIFIADSFNNRIREVTGGIISTFAGNGTAGFSGDGSAANAAELNRPNSIAFDGAGNLYIADTGNARIRKIDTSGNISTIAGNGTVGYSGDGGNATAAEISPNEVAVDASGNIYIAELNNSRIRKITNGTISTIAGNGTFGYTGDGGTATSAQISVYGIALDSAGNIYFADPYHNRVRQVSSNGNINTVAGNGTLQYSGDGGPASHAQLLYPTAVAVDKTGAYYIADTLNNVIRKVTKNGTISTVAGVGSFGYSGDGGPAVNAQLGQPGGVAVDGAGNIYISDTANAVVRKVTPDGNITTWAGNGVPGETGDGGPAWNAKLTQPNGLATDAPGNLYIADSDSYEIRKVTPDGTITTVAGTGFEGFSGDGGPAGEAQLDHPISVAVDQAGNLFIADVYNNRVRKVSGDGMITTVAGSGAFGNFGDGGAAVDAEMDHPSALTVDSAGNLYIVDAGNNTVRKVTPDGTITTIAGSGLPGYSGDNGPATGAQFDQPSGIAVDANGNIYVADSINNVVRLLQPTP